MTDTARPPAGVFVVRDPGVCAALEQLLEPHRTDAAASVRQADTAALLATAQSHAASLIANPDEAPPAGETIEQVLDRVHGSAFSEGRAQATAEGREWSETMAVRVRRADRDTEDANAHLRDALSKIADLEASRPDPAEADVELRARIVELETEAATTGRDLELAEAEVRKLRDTVAELHADLEKARKTPSAPPAPRATGTRIADRKAFADLADLMDNQARAAKSADATHTLRLAARAVRKEIVAVYGSEGKKAS